MIELYFAPTPNGWKISIMLEECGLPYMVVPVNITRGEQHKRDFLKISPNGRIPAIVDRDPADGGEPIAMFETGAILLYLAEKSGRLFPQDVRGRYHVQQWLMWQMSGLGPMLGQNGHFLLYAPEKIAYAIDRYGREARRLYGVLDTQLGETGAYVAGNDYSIADIACFPWVMTHKAQGLTLDEFPHVRRWFTEVRARPQVQKGLAVGRSATRKTLGAKPLDDKARENLFGLKPSLQPQPDHVGKP
jgi:GSH-dependent disulfide-bond oxidoreductase